MSSDLTLTTDGSDFLAMAEELGIPLQEEMSVDLYSGGRSPFTSYLRPKNIRSIYDAHKLDGQIRWTEEDYDGNPDNRTAEILYTPDANGGDPRPIQGIIELRGIVVSYQQRDELRYFDGERTQTLCSVIGYTQPNGTIVRDLPSKPYGMKHSFVQDRATKKWSVDTTKPNQAVERLGLVGYRGERTTSCAECIRCGMSSEIIEGIGDNGADKKISCEPRGKLFMAVYEVSVMQRVKQKNEGGVKGKAKVVSQLTTYKVADLVDLGGDPIGDFIFIEVPMSKSSIKGNYVKGEDRKKDEEKSVDGFETYVRNLEMTYKDPRNPLRSPKCHWTSLKYKKNFFAPTFQAHFTSLGSAGIEEFKKAVVEWKTVVPVRTVEELELEEVQSIEVDGTINVVSQAVAESTPKPAPMKKVEVVEDEITLDEIPF